MNDPRLFGGHFKTKKMKQLFIRDEPSQIFFDKKETIFTVLDWVKAQIWLDETVFELNEAFTCTASIIGEIEETIQISGDEDSVELSLKEIEPIKL
jgi:hypothetical protein